MEQEKERRGGWRAGTVVGTGLVRGGEAVTVMAGGGGKRKVKEEEERDIRLMLATTTSNHLGRYTTVYTVVPVAVVDIWLAQSIKMQDK